jgi:hypothetical protein
MCAGWSRRRIVPRYPGAKTKNLFVRDRRPIWLRVPLPTGPACFGFRVMTRYVILSTSELAVDRGR